MSEVLSALLAMDETLANDAVGVVDNRVMSGKLCGNGCANLLRPRAVRTIVFSEPSMVHEAQHAMQYLWVFRIRFQKSPLGGIG